MVISLTMFSQESEPISPTKEKYSNKGKMYFFWGWNRSKYTTSDIHFHGDNYDFTLHNVVAKDRQSPFGLDPYFNPVAITIPQYNYRLGYFFSDKYEISFGFDHMKYVMVQDQTVKIDGEIQNSGTKYDGSYNNDDIVLKGDFLRFEHTDGLNYLNLELRRMDNIYRLRLSEKQNIDFNYIIGLGAGILYPRTNTTLLNNKRYDEFHVAGYGTAVVVGFNITFLKHFFIQSEGKAGYINMPDIRTTMSSSDKADQQFSFIQGNILFGGRFQLTHRNKK